MKYAPASPKQLTAWRESQVRYLIKKIGYAHVLRIALRVLAESCQKDGNPQGARLARDTAVKLGLEERSKP